MCLLIRGFQLFEIRDHDFRGALLDIVFAGVFAVGEFAFDIESLAFVEDLGHHFGSLAPGDEVVPGRDRFFFAAVLFVVFVGGHGHAGHFFAFGVFLEFDLLTEEADQLYAVVNC